MIITPEESRELFHMVRTLIRWSTILPGGRLGNKVNTTGRSLLTPGVNTPERVTYPAFWTRDPAWVAEAGLVGFDECWGWTTLLCETMQGATGRTLASGAKVPPYTVPDHVNPDGGAVFYPGTYDSGENQGGATWGLLPPHDDQYWVTFSAHACMVRGDDPRIGNRRVRTRDGEMPLWKVCDLAHHAFAVDPDTGCCVIEEERHQVDWGYNDAIIKTGQALFPSLLRLESCIKLAAVCRGCGVIDRALELDVEAQQLRAGIAGTFTERRHGETWLRSVTGVGDIPDVWGTAFAVHRGFVADDLADDLARSLVAAYRGSRCVRDGQVRHMLHDDGFWPQSHAHPGTYQNGAWWGYPIGWYVSAIARIDRQAARELFEAYLSAMRRGWNDEGAACAYECVNEDLNHRNNPGYLMTVVLPWIALGEAGLLDGSQAASP